MSYDYLNAKLQSYVENIKYRKIIHIPKIYSVFKVSGILLIFAFKCLLK